MLAHHVAGGGGIQGRGLTLGSGSVDFFFGTKLFYRINRFFVFGSAQYALRTEGDFDYQFADDWVWNIGPAYYLMLDQHSYSLALRGAVSGEDKGNDSRSGELVSNTKISNVFAGPELLFTAWGKYTIELGVDMPISTARAEALEEPSYRVRTALGIRF